MNREQKATVIEEIAADISESNAVLAVDYRGISVGEAAELRGKLREADASFRIVKNSLTERAAEQIGAADLKPLLAGPTALTFVRGDVALAARAIADQARATQLLPFKGGIMDGASLTPEEIGSIARLPARDVLYGQLVGLVASPISGLVRTLNALISGVAIQLSGVLEKKQSGELPAGEPPTQEPQPRANDTATEPEPPANETAQQDAAPVAASEEKADPEPAAPAENDNQTDASAPPVEAKEDQ